VESAAPAWFTAALADAPRLQKITVAGAEIALRCWGRPGDPGLVLVHGGAAHAAWWDHVAPLLAGGRHVVALDISGHGDSARRPSYDATSWADEVGAAAKVAGDGRPVTVVGHSMGGRIALVAASRHRDRIDALAMVDTPLAENDLDEAELLQRRRRPTRVYAVREDALARFVTLPEQDVVLPYVKDHVAGLSVHEVEGGWTWKFDSAMSGSIQRLRPYVEPLTCPAVLFRCEHGLVPDGIEATLSDLVGEHACLVELPGVGHHPMLDEPLALVAALRTQLAAWKR
jgi:pimeloyl-ACP methyl ester carboxylesterase